MWLEEGDVNTEVFHGSVKSISIRNLILALKVGDSWVKGWKRFSRRWLIYFLINLRNPL